MKNPWKFENFRKGPLMSFVGVFLIAASVAVYLLRDDSEMFATALLGAGLLALGLKDPIKPVGGAGAVILFIAMMLALSSCVTARKCLDKFGGDSVRIVVRDTVPVEVEVPVPADSLEGEITRDSLDLLLSGVIDSLTHSSNSDKLQIKFWRDQYNNALKYRVDTKPDTLKVTTEVPVEVKADCPPSVVVKPEQVARWYVKVWRGFQVFSGYLVLAEVFVLALVVLFIWWSKLWGRVKPW